MLVVLVARFVAVLRSVVGFIAGANRMPFAKFMMANSAGAVAWALFLWAWSILCVAPLSGE
jgi:membrane protein DedA with SNARE-associated domain